MNDCGRIAATPRRSAPLLRNSKCIRAKGGCRMKVVYAALTVLLGLIVYGTTQPATEPTITIEGHQAPYGHVQIWSKHALRTGTVVAYYDPDTQIDFVE